MTRCGSSCSRADGAEQPAPLAISVQGMNVSQRHWRPDHAGDQITMRIGMDLYDRYGDDMTRDQLHRGITKAVQEMYETESVEQVRKVE